MDKNVAKSKRLFIKTQFLLLFEQKFDEFYENMATKYGLIGHYVINLSARVSRDTIWGLMEPLELISRPINECIYGPF